ncbi:MAG: hypothetical protein ACPGJF_17860 [Sinimarinibacterium flocculans]|uniref:hypothetical protein n=1 Tax=Sinimarinibacterium flocculans TaxID=985250 RepID=UPI003C518E23
MNLCTSVAAFILAGLFCNPAHAIGAADAGPMIAEQGNAALQSIRSDMADTLSRRLRDQVDLCHLAVEPATRTAAASVAGRIEVARPADAIQAPHCASRREV